MEPLFRRFRARPSVVIPAAMLLLLFLVFLAAGVSAVSRRFADITALLGVMMVLGTLGLLFSRLDLRVEGDRFSLIVSLFGIRVFQHDAQGYAWHMMEEPDRSLDTSGHQGVSRWIEVTGLDGNRHRVMGKGFAFLYGVNGVYPETR